MRLVSFLDPGAQSRTVRVGEWGDDDVIIDLGRAAVCAQIQWPFSAADGSPPVTDMIELIAGGTRGIDWAREVAAQVRVRGDEMYEGHRLRWRREEVRLLAPVPRPPSIRDFLMVEEHVRNAYENVAPDERPPYSLQSMAETPAYYKGNPFQVFGPDDVIPWPPYTNKMDYELELALVIGRGGEAIRAEDSDRHIAGYTIFNDWSARDIQMREMKNGLGPGLGKDFANSLGPCLRTADDFNPLTAQMSARIDGELWSQGTISVMLRSFPELIEWTSQGQALQPGDILGSGTIGRGCGLELGRFLTPGAVVELSVDGIGTLTNRVGEPGSPVRAPLASSQE